MCSSERKNEYSKYLSAINNHKLEETLEFFDNNCEIMFDHVLVAKGIDQIQSALTIQFSDPNYSHELEKYLPVDIMMIEFVFI